MLRFRYENRNYKLVFRYTPTRRNVPTITSLIYSDYGIGTAPRYILFSAGESKCNPKDKFNREVGRVKAMSRALSAGNFPREIRMSVMDMWAARYSEPAV